MSGSSLAFEAEIWIHTGQVPWHFVTLPLDLADEVRARGAGAHRPFGSLPIRATLGSTTWETSLFADSKAASYLLPIKAQVRRRERLDAGQLVRVQIELQRP